MLIVREMVTEDAPTGERFPISPAKAAALAHKMNTPASGEVGGIPVPTAQPYFEGEAEQIVLAQVPLLSQQLLVRPTVFEMVSRHRPLIEVTEDTPILECIRIMQYENVHSLPVVSSSTPATYLGMLDTVAILGSLIFQAGSYGLPDEKDITPEFVNSFLNQTASFAYRASREGRHVAELNSWARVADALPLLSGDYHRLLIRFGATRQEGPDRQYRAAYRMLSQKDVVVWVGRNIQLVEPALRYARLRDLGFVKGNLSILQISHKVPAMEALRKLYQNEASALAIVDDDGQLVGSLSTSEVRLFSANVYSELMALNLPVREFLRRLHSRGYSGHESVLPDTTFESALRTIVVMGVNRLWIVDGPKERPIGLISMSDIISTLDKRLIAPFQMPTASAAC